MLNEFDIFTLNRDINSTIKKGMKGTVLDVWGNGFLESEFVKKDGTNYTHEGFGTFAIDPKWIG